MSQPNEDKNASVSFTLEINDVSKRYGARWAISRLQFSLAENQSLLLTGHNGSGKSTLLKMIATAAFPTAGEIKVFQQDVKLNRNVLRTKVALLSHANFLYEDLSASENLSILGKFLGVSDLNLKIENTLTKVKLIERQHSPVRQFSAGMRKRLAIARLLLKQPKMALLDEPFGELDPQGIVEMEGFISELKSAGCTIVLATHLIPQGLRLTDKRLHLENGRMAEPNESLSGEG
jgi:heme exporter protein A